MKLIPLARAVLAAAILEGCVWGQPRVAIAVFNRAGAPDTLMADAMETARGAFHAAGIDTEWTLCGAENCRPPRLAEEHLELLVMPRLRMALPGNTAGHTTAGYAMADSVFLHPRAYAFLAAAKTVADRAGRPLSLVLACILVHETAHLMGMPHEASGVMRNRLDAEDMDRVAIGRAFSAEEEKVLRARVRSGGPRPAGLPWGYRSSAADALCADDRSPGSGPD